MGRLIRGRSALLFPREWWTAFEFSDAPPIVSSTLSRGAEPASVRVAPESLGLRTSARGCRGRAAREQKWRKRDQVLAPHHPGMHPGCFHRSQGDILALQPCHQLAI